MSTFLLFLSISSFFNVHMGVSSTLTCYIPNLFRRSLMYKLRLMNMSFVCLFDLQSKKKVLLSHHAHFKFILHAFYKILTKKFISSTKYNIINVNLYNQDIFVFLFIKMMVSILPMLKSLSIRKDLSQSYHTLGACFKLYKDFLSLKT